jgi:hypothetical protein
MQSLRFRDQICVHVCMITGVPGGVICILGALVGALGVAVGLEGSGGGVTA